MEKIYTAKDRAQELGFVSYHAFLESIVKHPIPQEITEGGEVFARVDKGRWIADCKDNGCKGAGYIDPEVDGFFCTACQNANYGGKLRHVVFPENYKDIEAELLIREVVIPAGMFGTQGALSADGLPRSWNPGESIEDLIAQREGYQTVTKDQLMNEYSLMLNRVKELEAALAAKEGGNGV